MPSWFVAFPVRIPPWFEVLNIPEALRVFQAEDVHCTLAFLGDMNSGHVDDVVAQMRRISHQSFDLTLDSPILLPSTSTFTALSLRVRQGHDTMASLIAAQRNRFYEIAAAKADNREVLPHVTIARPPRKFSSEQKQELLQWCSNVDIKQDPIRIDRVALYTWSENRKERQFQIVASHDLVEAV